MAQATTQNPLSLEELVESCFGTRASLELALLKINFARDLSAYVEKVMELKERNSELHWNKDVFLTDWKTSRTYLELLRLLGTQHLLEQLGVARNEDELKRNTANSKLCSRTPFAFFRGLCKNGCCNGTAKLNVSLLERLAPLMRQIVDKANVRTTAFMKKTESCSQTHCGFEFDTWGYSSRVLVATSLSPEKEVSFLVNRKKVDMTQPDKFRTDQFAALRRKSNMTVDGTGIRNSASGYQFEDFLS